MNERFVNVHIVRGDGEVSNYRVEFEDHLTVKRVLDRIYLAQDRTVAYRHFCCNTGNCMSCLVKVNGKNVQGCKYVVEAGADLRLEVADEGRALRDLTTDFSREGSRAIPKKRIEIST